MCTPNAQGYASRIAAAVKENGNLAGVNLSNLQDMPRQFALTTRMQLPQITGIVVDPTRRKIA